MSNKFDISKDELKDFFGSGFTFSQEGVKDFIPEVSGGSSSEQEIVRLNKLSYLLKQYNQVSSEAGVNKWFVPGTPFGIENCPKHRAFFEAGLLYNERCFMAGNRTGKALQINELVHTKHGPVPLKEISVGDYVIGSSGKEVLVTGYFPQGLRPTYKVTVSDGASVLCDEEHLWAVRELDQKTSQSYSIKTTKELIESPKRHALPERPCVDYPEQDVPVDPYLLGLLIGDGGLSTSTVMFTTADSELVDYCTKIAGQYSCTFTKRGNLAYQFVSVKNNLHGKNYNILKDLLNGLSLNCTSHHKRIPEEYKHTSYEHRVALLQGLMDTDGYCGKNGQAVFYSVSKGLCDDVAYLIRSLGCNASVFKKKGRYLGQEHTSWLVNVRRTNKFIPFRLTRKAERYSSNVFAERGLVITSIEYVGETECACITIDSEDKLFLAGDFLLTHNSVAGAFEASCHSTGVYPSWWKGRTFDKPTHGWAVGSTARATRDTAQKELIGPVGAWGTGMIPKDKFGKFWALAGVPQGIDIIQVKHISGGWSTIGFKNYEQPLSAFYGTALDWVWPDEECPIEHYNEMLIRTMTTNGLVFNTFTPLKGLTPMVVRFAEKADYLAGAQKLIGLPDNSTDSEHGEDARIVDITTSKAIIQAGWDDAPWLSEKSKEQMEADTEPHLRAARRSGRPSMGSGNVFPISLEEIMCTPFKIPNYYKRMYALDVGWNRTAVLWGALDPQTDILYLYDEHYVGEQQPPIHAAAIRSRGEWIPGVIDPASRGRSQGDGKQLMKDYNDLGLRLMPAINARDAGISALWQRMVTGNLKVFTSLHNFTKEFVLYRRNLKGHIVDENDHLMDCYSADTEVLTADGWKFWPDVIPEDMFATVNLETNNLEYQEASELLVKDYSGPMVAIKNKSLDFLVTPNHRMVVYPRDTSVPTIKLAKDLSIWDKLKGTCSWEGEDFIPPIDVSQEDWAEFLGWFVSEGHTVSTPRIPGYGYQVGISQSIDANPSKCKSIETLLSKFPMKWHFNGKDLFYCSNKQLWTILRPLGNKYNKYIPDEIKNAKPTIMKLFIEAAIRGDGWHQGNSFTYATTSKRLADDMQEVILKSGDNSTIREIKAKPYNIRGRSGNNTVNQYWVYKTTVANPYLRDSKNTPSFSKVEYEGKVYCATVPNGTLVIRRKSRIIVAGNCARYIQNNLARAKSLDQLRSTSTYSGLKRYNI